MLLNQTAVADIDFGFLEMKVTSLGILCFRKDM